MIDVRVHALCVSERKGTVKTEVPEAQFVADWGIQGDAHAGHWHRQVSLLSKESIDAFNAQGAGVKWGEFGENIVLSGYDLKNLPVGTIIVIGEVVLLVTQIGKQCHSGCDIQKRMGVCIMPTNGIFARVLHGGTLRPGAEGKMYVEPRVAIICLSDKASRGEREDGSTPVIARMVEQEGMDVVEKILIPDDRDQLSTLLISLCDGYRADLVLTTGGTGLSERDITPETTLSVMDKRVPGIAEAMRASSLAVTPRAMLSRGESVIRKKTLIINLPGSPKACRENLAVILPALGHGIGTMRGSVSECASPMHDAIGGKE